MISNRKRKFKRFTILVLVLGGIALGVYFLRHTLHSTGPGGMTTSTENQDSGITTTTQKGRKILYWQDAMNPGYRSDKPGKAPDGMDLVPVYAEESPGGEDLPPGSVHISSQKQQLIGVQYGEVLYQPLSKTIRTVGRLAYDETKIEHIHTKINGWIEQVYVDFTGKLIEKNQPLLSIYSPELVSTQQEFLIASRARDSLKDSSIEEIAANAAVLYESARERLRLWDINEEQIRKIEERGTPTKTLTLYSPISGFVLSRNAFKGQRVTPETELYTIADLSSIWVLSDVYEYEVPLIKLGESGTITLTYFPGRTFEGKVTYIYPQLEYTTRTLKIRLEVPNPGFELKPDMYANVELRFDYGKQLAVPQEAVLDSGAEQIVFVAREGGYFEPRKVKLGQKAGDFFIVLEGVKEGERVVTSANFLIDSESQLKSAIGGMGGLGHAGHGSGVPPVGTERKSPGQEQVPSKSQPDHSQHQVQPPPVPADHSQHQSQSTPAQSDHSQHLMPSTDHSQDEQSATDKPAAKEAPVHPGH